MADVARFELYWTCAYHAEELPSLTPEKIEMIAPEAFGEIYLHPHPALYLVASPYPAYRIWLANQSDEVFETEETPGICSSPEQVVINCAGIDVTVTLWDKAPFEMLLQLANGLYVEDAYLATTALDPDFDLTQFLSLHLFDGTFCGFGDKTLELKIHKQHS